MRERVNLNVLKIFPLLLLTILICPEYVFAKKAAVSFTKHKDKNFTEKSRRTGLHSITHRNKDGSITKEIYLGRINYRGEDGKWHAINIEIKEQDGVFYNNENTIKSRFGQGKAFYGSGNNELVWELKTVSLVDAEGRHVSVLSRKNPRACKNKNKLKFEEIFEGIDDSYKILSGKVKNNIILKALPPGQKRAVI